MRNFSFFYHLFGSGGAEIRVKQIAKYLNGNINPNNNYENDICIYVLGAFGKGKEVPFAYYDVIDCGRSRLALLKKLTHGDIIVTSQTQFSDLKRFFRGRKLFLIPHHHCNFERFKQPVREVKVVGCMGGDSAVQWSHENIAQRLKEIGLEWKFSGYKSKSREDIVNFYKTIDIHLTYRISHHRQILLHMNPLKLNNAGSFGIPSVSFPEPSYFAEWKDSCLWGTNMDEIVNHIKFLAETPSFYKEMSEKAFLKAEEYHISNISKLYESLDA